MPSYEYTAKDRFGNEFTGLYRDIDGIHKLQEELGKVGYVMVRARRSREAGAGGRRVRLEDIVAFSYKFAGMYSAGLSVTRCLETLEEQTERLALRQALADIRQRIEAGSSLAKAFEPHRAVFSELFVGMVEAGETAGKLSEALTQSTIYLEKRAQLKSKICSAFVYPITVGVVCVAVLSCLLLFVIPVFTKLYAHLHVPLPLPTLLLVMLSQILRKWLWLVLGMVAFSFWALRKLSVNKGVRRGWERIKTRIPMIGHLNQFILVSRFIRPFAMLISVGVSVIDAIRIASEVTHSEEMARISEEMQKTIQAGNTVAKALEEHAIFPGVVIQMAASGEQVGKLPEMLGKGVDIVDRDIDRRIDALVIKLEPLLTLVIGLVVGSVLIGIYLPMFDYMTYLK
jgi:type IV pilus assembly protein PilC